MKTKKQSKKSNAKQIILFIIIVILFLLIIFAEDIIKLTDKNRVNLAKNSENEITTNERISNEPNVPQLSAGMIPVKWDGRNWRITTQEDKEWYNYENGKPAYVMLNDGKYQSELIRDMTNKELAENNVGVGVPDDPNICGSIYLWIPRFAVNNDTNNIKYIKGTEALESSWSVPEIFSHIQEEETKPNFVLTGVWVEKDVDIEYSSKITQMNQEESIYGFIANTKPKQITAIDTATLGTYVETINNGTTKEPLPTIDSTNLNLIVLQIVNTSNQEPIKAKASYNKDTDLIEVQVTYSQFGIEKILYENTEQLELVKNNNIITANTKGIYMEEGNKTITIIDKAGNTKSITINVVPAIWVTYYASDGTLAFAREKNPLPEKGTATVYSDMSTYHGTPPWYGQRNNIKTVEFVNKISPISTAWWFYNCNNITTINNMKENLDTAKVTDMTYMFYNCSSLKSIDVSNFDTSNVTSMTQMFYNCSSLKSVDVSNFDTSKVTNINNMFFYCSSLGKIDLSSFNLDKVTDDVRYIIGECNNLSEIKFGEKFTKEVYLPNVSPDGQYCTGWYSDIECTEENKVADKGSNYTPTGAITLYAGVVPDIYVKLYTDGTLAFSSKNNLIEDKTLYQRWDAVYSRTDPPWKSYSNRVQNVIFVDEIKPLSTKKWFYMCNNLIAIENIENLDTSDVTDMSYTFCNCTTLKNVDVSNFDTSKVTNMSYMFAGCSALETINVSNFDISNVTNMNAMFQSCSNLTKIDISNFIVNSKTECSSIFNLCTSLTEIKIGDNWENSIYLPNPTGKEETCIGWYKAKEFIEENKISEPNQYYTPQGAITVYAGFIPNIYVELTNLGNNEYKLSFAHDKTLLTRVDYNISGTNYYATNSQPPWRSNSGQITTVEFLDEITPISTSRWFENFTKLTTILNVENLNTSRTIDMRHMFYYCNTLETIDVSRFDISEVRYMYRMFASCKSLKTLDLSSWGQNNVKDMSSMFEACENLESVNISNLDISNVTNMQCMFYQCKSLITLDANNWDTSNVENMVQMFYNCENLTTVYANNWDTGNVIDMNYMFALCYKLETLSLTNWRIDNVTNVQHIFLGCSSLKTLDLSNWVANGKTQNINTLFSGCTALETLNVKKLVTADVTNISGMFSELRSLTYIDMSEWDTSNVTDMNNMFSNCTNLKELNLSNFDTSNLTNMNNMVYGCTNLQKLDLSNFDTNKISSITNLFIGCDNLVEIKFGDKWNKSVRLPEPKKDKHVLYAWYSDKENINEVAKAGATYAPIGEITIYAGFLPDIYAALYSLENGEYKLSFAHNSELLPENKAGTYNNIAGIEYWSNLSNNTYTPPWLRNSTIRTKITTIEFLDKISPISTAYWFSSCSNLSNIVNLSNLDTSKSINMRYMFYRCNNLETLDLRSFDTSKVTDMNYMFSSCNNLKTLNLSDWNTSRVTNMSYMFSGCPNLELLNLSNWNTSNVTYMTCMFSADMDLKTLDLSSFDTSNVIEMSAMFSDCINLETVYIGPEWTTENAATGDMTRGCPAEFVLNLYSVMSSVMRAVQNVNAI